MSIAKVFSRAITGMDAQQVIVEVHISNGLPSLSIVGMAETAVKESKDRVRSALLNAQFEFPQQRITVNLAPADLPKEGGRFDLPIAIGILAASGQIPIESLQDKEFIGELSLSGDLHAVKGVLPTSLACSKANKQLFLPIHNANEAALIRNSCVFAAKHVLEVCAHLHQQTLIQATSVDIKQQQYTYPDLQDVKGQSLAKRALLIAAAGQHSLLFSGTPGTGKTMLASRLPGILPEMDEAEAVETATVHSISQQGFKLENWLQRPFRAPHHTASAVALVGGGSQPKPGEISLSHNGVLFLDELPEFDRRVLEVLREPMESGAISISRAANQTEFPAHFQLIAAMNPCPCGYLGETRCRCTEDQVQRYRSKVSGPLMDRIDMLVDVPTATKAIFDKNEQSPSESSAVIREKVIKARQYQLQRSGKTNHLLSAKEVEQLCSLSETNMKLLERAITQLGLSMRAYHRILKVARTIADLDDSEHIETPHLTEAIGYRRLKMY